MASTFILLKGGCPVLPSSLAIFSRSSSFSTLVVAMADFRRRFSLLLTSVSRLFSVASPPARKRSPHSLSVAAVTLAHRFTSEGR